MFSNFLRKARNVADDPVLRKWLVRRWTGQASAPPAFTAHRPSYLNGVSTTTPIPIDTTDTFGPLKASTPERAMELPLAGINLKLNPGDDVDVFQRSYEDIETLLALHRFAWLPLSDSSEETRNWVQVLWSAWRKEFGEPDDGWAWHPYTAAERAVNILDLAEAHGLPEPLDDTLAVLARHAEAIFGRL